MDIKNNMYYYERNLNEYATYDKDAIRMDNLNKDIRPCFFRDSDRIIHSLSFTRYSDKTQVFSNDNL